MQAGPYDAMIHGYRIDAYCKPPPGLSDNCPQVLILRASGTRG